MIIVYLVVGLILLLIGVTGMFVFGDEVNPIGGLEILRYVSLWTAGSWLVAILWPLLLVSVVPALVLYGVWVGIKVFKHRELDY